MTMDAPAAGGAAGASTGRKRLTAGHAVGRRPASTIIPRRALVAVVALAIWLPAARAASRSAGTAGAAAEALAAQPPTDARAAPTPALASVDPRVRAQLAADGAARAIVILREDAVAGEPDGVLLAEVRARQDAVLAKLDGRDVELTRRFEYIAAFAARLTSRGLAALLADPLVEAVELDALNVPLLAEAVPVVHGDIVRDTYGLTGEGVNVAVLDTGIDPEHPDLADDIVAQHCFSSNGGCVPNNSVESDNAQDEAGHGTGVSGIITAKGVVSPPGVAPDAGIVAVRVFDDRQQAQSSDIVAGLEWVRRNRRDLNVKIVNMSLGSTQSYTGNCDSQDQARARVIAQLNALGVAVFAASGNAGASNAMSAPACLSNVISVGATYDAELGREPPEGQWGCGCIDETTSPDLITCFSNLARTLSFVAPGAMITHPRLGGGTDTTAGTSDASPMAAGVAALLLQADPDLRPLEIERLLQRTGTSVGRPGSALTFPRIDAQRAIEDLMGITPVPSASVSATPTAGEGGSPTPTATSEATGTPAPSVTLGTPAATATATPVVFPSDTATPQQSPTLTPTPVAFPTDTQRPPWVGRVYLPALWYGP